MTIDPSEGANTYERAGDVSDLRVSIIYEDIASGVRAKNCLDRLARQLNTDAEVFSVRLWSFGYLSDSGLRSIAAREAKDFEIILLATRGIGELPDSVKKWMAEWLKYRDGDARPCALAVMPDNHAQSGLGKTALLRYLSRIAETAGLDLVFPVNELFVQPSDEAVGQIVRRAINASPLLEGIVDDWQSYAHSGINE